MQMFNGKVSVGWLIVCQIMWAVIFAVEVTWCFYRFFR